MIPNPGTVLKLLGPKSSFCVGFSTKKCPIKLCNVITLLLCIEKISFPRGHSQKYVLLSLIFSSEFKTGNIMCVRYSILPILTYFVQSGKERMVLNIQWG